MPDELRAEDGRKMPVKCAEDSVKVGDLAEYPDKVWHAEGGNGDGPDFTRLSKECRNNVRDCLGRLEVELMAL